MGKRKYSDEYLLSKLVEYYNEYNKNPKYQEFDKDKKYPSANIYRKYFGTWNNALVRAGLKVNINTCYNKETILNNVIDFYKKHNRSPYYNEIDYSNTAVNNYWNSWNEMLIEANLPINVKSNNNATKNEGIILLKDLHKKLGKIPSGKDVNNHTDFNRGWFANKFGSFKNALYEANLIDEDSLLSKEERINLSLDLLRQLYEELNRVPTVDEYDAIVKNNKKYYFRRSLETVYGKKYNNICLELFEDANDIIKTKEEIINEYIEAINELGEPPMNKDLRKLGLPGTNTIKRKFGLTYNEFIKFLGHKPTGTIVNYKTKEEMLNDILELYKELGRIPTYIDINERKDICAYSTYVKKFESYCNVLDILELEYTNKDLFNSDSGKGFIITDKKGEICRSYGEMIITNLLIDNNIKYIKEVRYSDAIQDYNKKSRFDWFLPDYNVYIEFFGLFNSKSINKDSFIGEYTRNTLEKIKLCKNNNVNLISIFPKELKNNMNKIINKLLKQNINIYNYNKEAI